jgi:methanogenic corrinoid protein MtbC1
VIVIPPELESKKAELEAKIREWAQQQTEDIEQMIMEWIQSQVRKGIQTICPLSAALPGVVIATGVWQSLRKRRK